MPAKPASSRTPPPTATSLTPSSWASSRPCRARSSANSARAMPFPPWRRPTGIMTTAKSSTMSARAGSPRISSGHTTPPTAGWTSPSTAASPKKTPATSPKPAQRRPSPIPSASSAPRTWATRVGATIPRVRTCAPSRSRSTGARGICNTRPTATTTSTASCSTARTSRW